MPDYALIVPIGKNDGLDCPNEAPSCPDIENFASVDQWIQTNLSRLIQSPAFQNSVLIYTWEESVLTDTANRDGQLHNPYSPEVRSGYQSTTSTKALRNFPCNCWGSRTTREGQRAQPNVTEFF